MSHGKGKMGEMKEDLHGRKLKAPMKAEGMKRKKRCTAPTGEMPHSPIGHYKA